MSGAPKSMSNPAGQLFQMMLGADRREPFEFDSPCYRDALREVADEHRLDRDAFAAFMREYLFGTRAEKLQRVLDAPRAKAEGES